jgi:medium-chain acyl-[acyl-carrier-protein] hydrolase
MHECPLLQHAGTGTLVYCSIRFSLFLFRMEKINENGLTTKINFTVTSAETDMYARLRLGAMVNYLIQAASDSADRLGFGYGSIRRQNLFWVLSRLTIEIFRPLRWHENVEVETWPKNVERVLYLRDFILRDSESEIIARATSGWLAIDLESRRIKKIEGIEADYFTHLKDKHALSDLPGKLHPADGGEKFEICAGYFDIDLNGHVTTTRYIDWMMDTFGTEFHRLNFPRKLSLNLNKETMPGEMLRLMRKHENLEKYLFEGSNPAGNANAFRATLEF